VTADGESNLQVCPPERAWRASAVIRGYGYHRVLHVRRADNGSLEDGGERAELCSGVRMRGETRTGNASARRVGADARDDADQ